jgi:multiple antibiotic resistance protein
VERAKRLELSTYCMASSRSSQLSYARITGEVYRSGPGLVQREYLGLAWAAGAHDRGMLAEMLKAFVPLFIIVSPLGALPLFLAMTANDLPAQRMRTAWIAALTTGIVLGAAVICGEAVFRFFGVTIDAFRIAGGVLLFLYAIDMVQMKQSRMRTTQEEVDHGTAKSEVGIIPLAIPMLAGPGAIATAMVLRMQAPHEIGGTIALMTAICAVAVTVWLTFRLGVRLEGWLNPVWMGILLRLEGLLIAAIAVQMLVAGITGAFALRPPG